MAGVIIRKLEEGDLLNGFLASLDSLRKASGMDNAKDIFEIIDSNPHHVILVAVTAGRVIGSVTMLIEQKFIHGGGKVCHIEDVVVDGDAQRRGTGQKLILAALGYAKNAGCYKTILDCMDDVRPFYEKLGFARHSSGMRFNH